MLPVRTRTFVAGMRDILWRKDAMCDTISTVNVPAAWQNAQGHFKYTMPCFVLPRDSGTRREPFNFTPMAVKSISFGSPHVRTYALWGVRVVSLTLTKSRKITTRTILRSFS